jgi:hypothetical protein
MVKPVIPSQKDFENCRVKIIKLLGRSDKPVTRQKIAEFIKRPANVTEVYCDRLSEAGQINYIPIPFDERHNFGYVLRG